VAALGIRGQDRSLDPLDFPRTGALNMGVSTEIPQTAPGVHPFDTLVREYETEALVKPWLKDPEILAIWAGAAMEGRGISPAELQGTTWWRTHNANERAWISLNASDPSTATQTIEDNRLNVMSIMQEMGIDNASPGLINYVADRWTRGEWSQAEATTQIQGLSDPYARVNRDPGLAQFAKKLDTTRGREDEVRAMVNRWLGPAYAQGWNASAIAQWAGEFRNNPDAATELNEILRGQRLALFPEYENPNLTYEDIAAPWRAVWQQEWGQMADESDPMFTTIVRMNDLGAAAKLLRTKGLEKGNTTVSNNLLGDVQGVFGNQVRQIPEFR